MLRNQSLLRVMLRCALAVGVALGAVPLSPGAAGLFDARRTEAANITVTTTADELNADGDCSLREAIRAANLNIAVDACAAGSGADVVTLGAGTYLLSIAGGGEDAALTGDLDITEALTITGTGAASTIVDGGLVDRVFHVNTPGTVIIQGMTIRNGKSVGTFSRGGAVAVYGGGTVNLTSLTMSNNSGELGGAVHGDAGVINIINSTIANNQGTAGGAVYSWTATINVANTVVQENTGAGQGGGLYHSYLGATNIIDSVVKWNSAALNGGGLVIQPSATMTVLRSTIAENGSGHGGGVYSAGTLTIDRSTLTGNTTPGYGGGIMHIGGPLTLVNSTVSGNTAFEGAGLFTDGGATGIVNTTIAANTATTGGGLRQRDGAVTLSNALLGDNTATTGADCFGPVITGTHPNFMETTAACVVTGTAPLTGAPLLGALANNGGLTQTHALLAGSPALHSGSAAVCSAAPVSAQDQRGTVRPQGPGCDLGAFELAAAPVAGGKNLKIATGSIDLSWTGGTAQTGYTLLQYNTSTAAANLIPLAAGLTSYSDAAAVNGVMYCYVLVPTGPGGALGLSDLLCGMAGIEIGTVIPNAFALMLGGTANATVTWAAPAGGADSYLLQRIPLDGSPITNVALGGGATTTAQAVTTAGTCFQLIAFKGAGFGTSDVLCGVPGVSTLAVGGAKLQAADDALAETAERLSGLALPTLEGHTQR